MSLAIVYSRASIGIDAPLITIEVHISNGIPSFNLVGLAETSIKEAKDRVRSALINANFSYPAQRITVNLAPADLPKDGARFDLPIAIGILVASGQVSKDKLAELEFVGELALNNNIRSIKGIVPVILSARKVNRGLIIPHANLNEASLIKDYNVFCAKTLFDVASFLNNKIDLPIAHKKTEDATSNLTNNQGDLTDIIGQQHAKRGLLIAATGGHNLLFLGPPGTGKTMLANRIISILPEMTEQESIETASIISLAQNNLNFDNWRIRPFRSPHHSSSMVALIGGGSNPKPGEISLSHNGVLFLDELPEFEKKVLDSLREPLEARIITISRANAKVTFPANFQLIAAMNPSPTGYYKGEQARISNAQILKYLNKLSGPFLDRFDLSIEVPLLPKGSLVNNKQDRGLTSKEVKKLVIKAREIQLSRNNKINAKLSSKEIDIYCKLSSNDSIFLEQALLNLGLSIRAYHRILKVARSIADLEQETNIQRHHLAEALTYRAMDRLIKKLTPQTI